MALKIEIFFFDYILILMLVVGFLSYSSSAVNKPNWYLNNLEILHTCLKVSLHFDDKDSKSSFDGYGYSKWSHSHCLSIKFAFLENLWPRIVSSLSY